MHEAAYLFIIALSSIILMYSACQAIKYIYAFTLWVIFWASLIKYSYNRLQLQQPPSVAKQIKDTFKKHGQMTRYACRLKLGLTYRQFTPELTQLMLDGKVIVAVEGRAKGHGLGRTPDLLALNEVE